jgi:eukaryotic-like serine/threonine-protein kinase
MLYAESNTAAFAGQSAKARELARRAVESAQRADKKEAAANYDAGAALREALSGNMALAKQTAQAALALSKGRGVEAISAVALGWAGDSVQAKQLADDLRKRYPEDTVVHLNYLPTIRAAVALQSGDPPKALDVLVAASSHELGSHLYPIYLRGEAYLAERQGTAATEFQKIIDHPGIVGNDLIGALAHLQLGRAYAMASDTPKAKAAYQDFLTLWKDADSDVPILKQAKAEYAKLQ